MDKVLRSLVFQNEETGWLHIDVDDMSPRQLALLDDHAAQTAREHCGMRDWENALRLAKRVLYLIVDSLVVYFPDETVQYYADTIFQEWDNLEWEAQDEN